MDYRSETKRCYDLFADDFDTKFEVYIQQYLHQEITELARRLPPPATILDLGSGPGNQALYLQHQGYKLTCIDISETMVEKCRQKGLNDILLRASTEETLNGYTLWDFPLKKRRGGGVKDKN